MADVNINLKVVSGAALRSIRNIEDATNKTAKSVGLLNKAATTTGQVFRGAFAANLATQFVNNFTAAVSSFITAGAGAAARLETLSAQFEVLTGSAGEANAIVKDLVEFAARTPFRFEGIASAAQRLLSFGFAADTINDTLQDLGDVSAASGADIGELSLIFGQVSAAGKLTGERLLQFQERAIPIGPAIARTLGVAESSVRDLVKRGEVDFATFEKAFQSLNDEGQFAFEGLARRSQTLEGRLSTLAEDVELLSASFFTALQPAFKAIVQTTSQVITQIRGFTDALISTADGGSFLISIVTTVVNTLGFLIQAFQGVRAFATLVSGVIVGIGTTALTAVEGLVKLAAVVTSLAGIEFQGLNEAAQGLEDLRTVSQQTADSLVDDSVDIAASIITVGDTIDDITKKTVANFKTEQAAAEEKARAKRDSDTAEIESEKQKRNLLQLFAQDANIAEEEARAELVATREARASEDFQFLVTNLGKEQAARVAAQAKRLADEGKNAEALKVIGEARVKAKEEERKSLDEQDKQREANLKSSLGTISGLQSSNNKTLVAIGKAAALAQVAIDGPVAVTKALSAAPPPFNFALAAAVGAAVAAQAAKIAGVGFQDGGVVGGNSFSGDQVPIRVNSGEMVLNRQQQSQLFDIANGNGTTGQQTIQSNITVELDGEVVGRAVSRQVADGLELGELI